MVETLVEASGLIVPRWARLAAATAPVVLLATAAAAESLTTAGHNPIRQTLSVLAASDRAEWVMSAGIALSAGCLIAVGLGLFMVRPVARLVLVAGGASGVAVAALPITLTATLHHTATCVSAFLLALWPALSVSRSTAAPAALRAPAATAASSTLFLLLAWTAYETQGGSLLGLAERVTVVAELVWPAVVVASTQFRRPSDALVLGQTTAVLTRDRHNFMQSVGGLRANRFRWCHSSRMRLPGRG